MKINIEYAKYVVQKDLEKPTIVVIVMYVCRDMIIIALGLQNASERKIYIRFSLLLR